jgi:hypothetical protein
MQSVFRSVVVAVFAAAVVLALPKHGFAQG